ncbi:IclR family transcriptional regulator [Gemmobacter sp.]|uniref:IclR family transcriptional regulator n=1 Tax=Gemmobacter sp. TaxID=1898957 RepID=UPI002AFFB0DD|nr:IclR family transcriptional regulator [Gemmobacter sp.]
MENEGIVQSVDRALSLLEGLAQAPDGARLSDLARGAGLAVSTAHRLLTTLERRGFAQFDPGQSRWHVGRKAFTVGVAYTRWQNLIASALPYLRRLRDLTRETANLGVIEDGEVVTLVQVESREIIRAISPPGGRAPVMTSGLGKAIIATWPDADIAALVARHGLPRMTRHSLQDMAGVWQEMQAIRASGFAYDNEEFTPGLRCVAATVWSAGGEAVGAISISGLAARIAAEDMPLIGARVRALADDLTKAMGGTPPAR